MGFLDSVVLPSKATPKTTPSEGGGFLASVAVPSNRGASSKIAELTKSATDAKAAADDASGLFGLFKNTFVQPIKDYFTDSVDQAKQFGRDFAANPDMSIYRAPERLFQSVVDSASQGFDQGVSAVTAIHDDYKSGDGSTAGDVANLARLAGSIPAILLSPISGSFAAAEKVPVLKQIADAINIPFTTTGVAAAYGTGKIFDVIPESLMSKETKDVLRTPISDLTSLTAQLTVGGKIMTKVSDVVKKGIPVTVPEAKRIVAEVQAEHGPVFAPDHEQVPAVIGETVSPPSPVPAETAFASVKKPAEKNLVPNVEEARKSWIENSFWGKTIKEDSTVKNVPISEIGDGKIIGQRQVSTTDKGVNEWIAKIKGGERPTILVGNRPMGEKEITILDGNHRLEAYKKLGFTEVPILDNTGGKLKLPVGTGEAQTSGLAKAVNKDAVKAGLQEGLGRLPEYSRMDMKEQAQLATDFIKSDPERAMRVALGEEHSPIPHLLPESVYTAMRITARDAGDFETLRKLALESRIVSDSVALGQRIKALDSGLREDPVSIMQEVKASREQNTKGSVAKVKKQIASELQDEIRKAASKRPTWEEFIKEVQCQY